MKNFTENTRVQVPAALHLCKLGYTYLDDITSYNPQTNVPTDIFIRSIKRLNPKLTDLECGQLLDKIVGVLNNDDLGKEFYTVFFIDEAHRGYSPKGNFLANLLEADKEAVEDFSVAVSYDEIIEKGYSLSAGQYFDIKIDYVDITEEEFNARMANYKAELTLKFAESRRLEEEIMKQLDRLRFNNDLGK